MAQNKLKKKVEALTKVVQALIKEVQHNASLAEGTLDGSTITCGWHGAKFDCTSGKLADFPAKINDLKSYTVTKEAEDIFIEV